MLRLISLCILILSTHANAESTADELAAENAVFADVANYNLRYLQGDESAKAVWRYNAPAPDKPTEAYTQADMTASQQTSPGVFDKGVALGMRSAAHGYQQCLADCYAKNLKESGCPAWCAERSPGQMPDTDLNATNDCFQMPGGYAQVMVGPGPAVISQNCNRAPVSAPTSSAPGGSVTKVEWDENPTFNKPYAPLPGGE